MAAEAMRPASRFVVVKRVDTSVESIVMVLAPCPLEVQACVVWWVVKKSRGE